MAKRPIFAKPDISDAATITVSGSVSGYPASNLLEPVPTMVWKPDSLTSVTITADLGSVVSLNMFGLFAWNPSATGTVQIEVADTEAGLSSPTYDSGSLSAQINADAANDTKTDFFHFAPDSNITGRWVRFTINDASNADGELRIGRMYIDNAWQPSRGLRFDNEIQFNDNSLKEKKINNGFNVVTGGITRSFRGQLSIDGSGDKQNALRLLKSRGMGKDIFFVKDPDDGTFLNTNSFYCLLMANTFNDPNRLQTNFNFTVEEWV